MRLPLRNSNTEQPSIEPQATAEASGTLEMETVAHPVEPVVESSTTSGESKPVITESGPTETGRTISENAKAAPADATHTFPMVSVIDKKIKESVPPELAEKVKNSLNKKEIISSVYPFDTMMKSREYNRQIELLQIELVKMQSWVSKSGERIVAVFEGRDAAGKGGTIKRFVENLNSRGARVVALAKPSETESGQWYFQRYVQSMPTKGEMVLFDRSWYNRAGVERVMGFCKPNEYLEFMRQAPEFERMLARSGIRLFKFWFSVSREEQLRRFMNRAKDPLKQWKLSPMDVESLGRWDQYTEAKESMLFYSDTADAPWTIVRSDDKKRARLNAIKFLLSQVPYEGKDRSLIDDLDPKIVGSATEIYESGENMIPAALSQT
ncbi:MAG: polyphosphate kinase 2 [Verrucomicrobiales bacterium]|nr:polyphosphate kinase 2 [Verrucomicrobiales bacterium]